MVKQERAYITTYTRRGKTVVTCGASSTLRSAGAAPTQANLPAPRPRGEGGGEPLSAAPHARSWKVTPQQTIEKGYSVTFYYSK